MVTISLQVRSAVHADYHQISDLIFFESHVHRHLDWRAPLDWIGSRNFWALENDGRILAALACPEDPPGIAWLRLFTHASLLSAPEAWSPLWMAARAEMESHGGATVAAIALHGWFQDILRENDFQLKQNIVMLEWKDSGMLQPVPTPSELTIKPLTLENLPQAVEVDASAFAPLWHNTPGSLQMALSQAIFATVAEKDNRIVGYQISTSNPHGAHLARLAVRKEAQAQGVGKALLNDLISRLKRRGLARLTVNTQGDNTASLALYKKVGFVPTGEQFPVYVYQI
jgi:ribosomal protein S18 acetylase RimI-like enzyme